MSEAQFSQNSFRLTNGNEIPRAGEGARLCLVKKLTLGFDKSKKKVIHKA